MTTANTRTTPAGLQSSADLAARRALVVALNLGLYAALCLWLAAILGALPLMLGTGVGHELRQPLGYAIVGGLVVSQVLTLFTTPVIYLYFDRLARRISGPRADPADDALPEPQA